MGDITLTTNLRLRKDSDSNTNFNYNLDKIDDFAGQVYSLQVSDDVKYAAKENVIINPVDASRSGSGSGGSIILGDIDNTTMTTQVWGTSFKLGTVAKPLTEASLNDIAIVSISSTQTLTNKTIDADNNTISNLAHGSEVDNPISGVHGVTGNVVGNTDAQSLTNKTIDADNNTISNLAHGSEVDNLSSGVHGAVGVILGSTDTQTITNKTIDGSSNTITNIDLTTAITGTLPVASGGTGSTTADGALTNLLPSQTSNAGKVLSTTGSTTQWASVATDLLLESNIGVGAPGDARTQVDLSSVGDIAGGSSAGLTIKAGIIDNADINSSAAIATTKLAALNTSIVPVTDGSGFLTSSAVTATQLSYVDATSSIQTQVDAKEPTLPITTRGDLLYRNASNVTARLPIGAVDSMPTSDGTDVSWVPLETSLASSHMIANLSSTGLHDGGSITVNGGDPAKYDVTAGDGIVVDNYTDPNNPVYTTVTWGAFAAQTVPDLATHDVTYIGINSSGALVEMDFTDIHNEIRDFIFIGSLVHTSHTQIDAINDVALNIAQDPYLQTVDLSLAIGAINISGNIYSANGANLKFDRSSGILYNAGINFKNSKQDPSRLSVSSSTGAVFFYTYQDGASGWTNAIVADIVPGSYDDGDGGLGSVGNNQWTIQRQYLLASGFTVTHYGQAVYSSSSNAVSGIQTEAFNLNPDLEGAILRNYLIVKGNATDLSLDTQAIFVSAGKFGGAGANGGTSSTTDLQTAYNNSPEPEIVLTSVGGAFNIEDAATPIGAPLFQICDFGAATAFFGVDTSGIDFTGSINTVTDTELAYVSGVTSALQTQLDAKLDDFSSTTDNALVRTDGTLGDAVQESGIIIDDSDNATLPNQAGVRLSEQTGNGTNYIGVTAPDAVTASVSFKLPDGDGSTDQVLKTDGSLNLGWATTLTNPMTAANDIIVGGASGATTRVDTDLLGDVNASIVSFDFVDGDVNTGTDIITEASHGMVDKDTCYLTTTGTLPAGLSLATKYFVIADTAGTFSLAATEEDVDSDTKVDITAAAGGGTHTVLYGGLVVADATSAQTGLVKLPDGEIRVEIGNGHGSTNSKIRRFTTSVISQGSSITYADSATLGGTFTINEAGIYSVNYSDSRAGGTAGIGISKESDQLTTSIFTITNTHRMGYSEVAVAASTSMASGTFRCASGDVIRAHTDGTPDNTNVATGFQITQIVKL